MTSLHPAARAKIGLIAQAATSHNDGIQVEIVQLEDHARLEFPSWPRAAEARGALAAAGFEIHEPGGPVLAVYTAGAELPTANVPGGLRELATAARGLEDFYGRELDVDEILALIDERELGGDDELPHRVRDEITRQRLTEAALE